MKNVLSILTLILLLILVSCTPGASQPPLTPSATETLRALPTPTRAPASRVPAGESTALVSTEPTATPFVHIVREGDTLLSIALRYGVGLEELVLVNPGIDPQFLSVGTSLRIPGPEGEAVDVLLPTPTPVALSQRDLSCFEALTGEFRCVATVVNTLPFTIETLSGIIGLYDRQGVLLNQSSTDSNLQFLPPERTMPLSAVFPGKPQAYAYADLQILSAIQVDSEVSSFVPIEIIALDWTIVEDGFGVLVEVQVNALIESDEDFFRLRILGMALNQGGQIVGYRLIDRILDAEEADAITEEFYILSLGPEVDDVSIIAEMVPNE